MISQWEEGPVALPSQVASFPAALCTFILENIKNHGKGQTSQTELYGHCDQPAHN